MTHHRLDIPSLGGPQRLDAFLRKQFPQIARQRLIRFFQNKEILISSRPAKKGELVEGGEKLSLPSEFTEITTSLKPNPKLKVKIVFEDDSVLVVSKPSGMPSVPHSFDETDTLANFLIAHDPGLVGVGGRLLEPGLIHRLDNETSGLMVVAKTKESFKDLKEQFRGRKVLKEYLALVEGLTEASGEIRNFIGSHPKSKKKVKVFERAGLGRQEAITQYEIENSDTDFTLLRVRILSGVRHQIRAHLAFLGHPVAGDKLYGSKAPSKRICLHAAKLGFFHPITGKWVEFEDKSFLSIIRNYGDKRHAP